MRDAILLLWRVRLRRSPARIVALVLLIAFGGGTFLAVAAGARRTANAYDEVADATDGAELGSSYVRDDLDVLNELVETMPAVGEFTQLVGFQVIVADAPLGGLTSFAYFTDPLVVERPLVLEGRMPSAANEVFVNEAGASGAAASVGDDIDIVVATPDFTEFMPETVTVVGVGVFPDEVYEDETGAKPTLVFADDFVATHRDVVAWGALVVTVAPGAGRADVVAQLLDAGLTVDNDRRADRERAWAAIRPLALTLAVLALLAGLAMIVVVGQALHRLVHRTPAEARSLAAAGCTRRMLLAADIAVVLTVVTAGMLGALGVAVLASPLFPQGRARRIAALRGFDVDVAVLGLGAVALLFALTAVVAVTLQRGSRPAELRAGVAPGVLGANPAVSSGVRFATAGRGLFGAVGGVAIGLASIVAAVTFTGSVQHLVSQPELAGFNWDLLGRDSYAQIDTAAVAERLRDDPDIERITGLTFSDVTIDGTPLPASVWARVKGSPWPTLSNGRVPAGPNEILMSPESLADLGYTIGDTVAVGFPLDDNNADRRVFDIDMTIVGTAVSPAIALSGSDTPRLDEGVIVNQADIEGRGFEYGGAMLFDVADGTDPESIKAQFPEGLPDDFDAPTEWFEAAEPAELIQARDAIDVLVLAVVALLIGVMATVAHNLLSFVRERRNAFAVLKAMGFTRRQIRTTVLCQSGLVIGVALVFAVPLGVIAGRGLFDAFAGDIGVIVEPTVPVLALAVTVITAVVLVQLVALIPAARARRTNLTPALRPE